MPAISAGIVTLDAFSPNAYTTAINATSAAMNVRNGTSSRAEVAGCSMRGVGRRYIGRRSRSLTAAIANSRSDE